MVWGMAKIGRIPRWVPPGHTLDAVSACKLNADFDCDISKADDQVPEWYINGWRDYTAMAEGPDAGRSEPALTDDLAAALRSLLDATYPLPCIRERCEAALERYEREMES